MLRLKLCYPAENGTQRSHDDSALHGTTILKKLVAPWAGVDSVVPAGSYFASVNTADALLYN